MSKPIENGISCDRTYWPEGGTAVPAIPADLTTLWDTHPDQVQIFVAECLINSGREVTAHFEFQEQRFGYIEIFLWEVGGDMLTVSFNVAEEIAEAASDYLSIRSEAQADEAASAVRNLHTLEDAIRRERSKLEAKLAQFREIARA